MWLQAVSVLQMRDATNSMVEVMRNEERFGEGAGGQKLELEKSAMAPTGSSQSWVPPLASVQAVLLVHAATASTLLAMAGYPIVIWSSTVTLALPRS